MNIGFSLLCVKTLYGLTISEPLHGSYDRLISTMGFLILVRWHLYIYWISALLCTHVSVNYIISVSEKAFCLLGTTTIDSLFSFGPWGTNFGEILTKIHQFSLKKMHLKMSANGVDFVLVTCVKAVREILTLGSWFGLPLERCWRSVSCHPGWSSLGSI